MLRASIFRTFRIQNDHSHAYYTRLFNKFEEQVYREKLGVPKRPLFGFPLFMKENYKDRPSNMSHAQYFHELVAKWRSLSEDQKNNYIDSSSFSNYKEEMEKWYSTLSPFQKDMYNLLKANNHPDVSQGSSRATWVPVEYADLYKSLPPRPCMSPNGLFVREFFAKGQKDTLANVVNMYSALSDMEKEAYSLKVEKLKREFISQVENFFNEHSSR